MYSRPSTYQQPPPTAARAPQPPPPTAARAAPQPPTYQQQPPPAYHQPAYQQQPQQRRPIIPPTPTMSTALTRTAWMEQLQLTESERASLGEVLTNAMIQSIVGNIPENKSVTIDQLSDGKKIHTDYFVRSWKGQVMMGSICDPTYMQLSGPEYCKEFKVQDRRGVEHILTRARILWVNEREYSSPVIQFLTSKDKQFYVFETANSFYVLAAKGVNAVYLMPMPDPMDPQSEIMKSVPLEEFLQKYVKR